MIGSEVTSGLMLLLPDALPNYQDKHGNQLDKDTFPIVDAVRMSMSYPFLFSAGRRSTRTASRTTSSTGACSRTSRSGSSTARIRSARRGASGSIPGESPTEGLPHRAIPRPLWSVPLLKAMFSAATEAWDRENMAHTVSARTVSIPTHAISTTDFNLTQENAQSLYGWGKDAATAFFNDPAQKSYLNSFGQAVGARRRRRGRREPGRAAGRDLKRGVIIVAVVGGLALGLAGFLASRGMRTVTVTVVAPPASTQPGAPGVVTINPALEDGLTPIQKFSLSHGVAGCGTERADVKHLTDGLVLPAQPTVMTPEQLVGDGGAARHADVTALPGRAAAGGAEETST